MSARRQVTIGNLDLDKLADICRKNGKRVQLNTTVALYSTAEQCELVIDGRIGFKTASDGSVVAVYDEMYGKQYAEIMADFVEENIEEYGNYHIVGRTEGTEWITVTVGS